MKSPPPEPDAVANRAAPLLESQSVSVTNLVSLRFFFALLLKAGANNSLIRLQLADPDWHLFPMKTTFEESRLGTAFTFCGQRYVKSALAVGEDARGWAHVFLSVTMVECEEISIAEVTDAAKTVLGAGD